MRPIARLCVLILLVGTILLLTEPVACVNTTEENNLTPPNATDFTAASPRPRVSMSWQAWVALGTTLTVLVVLAFEWASTTGVMITATMFLVLCGIITDSQLFVGLANNGVISIALLFALVEPVSSVKGIKRLFEKLLSSGAGGGTLVPCLKVVVLCMLVSGFTNNNPLVALLTPMIKGYCRQHSLSASQILLPMSFATLVGGTFTLIGTSTNLLFDGLMRSAGMSPLGFFEPLTVSGFPALLLIVLLVAGPRYLLPTGVGGMFRFVQEHGQEFFAELRVGPRSRLAGATVRSARKRLPDREAVRLVEIIRDRMSIFPLEESQVIAVGDHLVFSGNVVALQASALVLGLTFVTEEDLVRAFSEPKSTTVHGQAFPDASSAMASDNEPHSKADAVGDSPAHHFSSVLHYPPSAALRACPCADLTAKEKEDRRFPFGMHRRSHSAIVSGNVAATRLLLQHEQSTIVTSQHHPDDGQSSCITAVVNPSSQIEEEEATGRSTEVPVVLLPSEEKETDMMSSGAAPLHHTTFFEVVVASSNAALGSAVCSRKFQKHFHCAILACRNRDGSDLTGVALREHIINAGDTLLLLAGHDFAREHPRADREFFVVTQAGKEFQQHAADHFFALPSWFPCGQLVTPPFETSTDRPYRAMRLPWWHSYLIIPIFLAVIVAVAVFQQNISIAALVGVVLMISLKIRTPAEAIANINWDVMLMIAFSFGLGTAMNTSGLAAVIGQLVIDAALTGFPQLLVIALATTVITNVVINQAAAQVLFPIVLQMYTQKGEDPRPAILCLLCCTSYAFATPYGSPTSLIVLGPGGYKAADFIKFGLPINLAAAVMISLATAILFGIW